MIRLNQIKVKIESNNDPNCIDAYQYSQIRKKVCKLMRCKDSDIIKLQVVRRSLDGRKKPELFYSYVVDVTVENEINFFKKVSSKDCSIVTEKKYAYPIPAKELLQKKIVVVGMGPAGLFCAYVLAKAGLKPLLLERGRSVEQRQRDVEKFWETGKLNPNSNVQFGEGGAGTFSDGKLNTLVKDKYGRNKEVLRIFHAHGAPERILYDNKPHIGTDILQQVVKSMREEILSLGGEVRFESQLTDIQINQGVLTGIEINHTESVSCDYLVLAIGHSARDTFALCQEKQFSMEPKPFAVGLRVEHPQRLIEKNQYGMEADYLPRANYKVTAQAKNGRNVYSFCMCPGGYVVNASSEENRLAVNGMSYSKRDGKHANSAIIVSVTPEDYPSKDPLAGVLFQQQLEEKAYTLGQGKVPVQYYGEFSGQIELKPNERTVIPEIKGQYQWADLRNLFPTEIREAFCDGMSQFDKKIPGFAADTAILSGVESRTSSPVRILRNEAYEALGFSGIYPCGEGAGYAGGITSAAMDGIAVAEAILKQH